MSVFFSLDGADIILKLHDKLLHHSKSLMIIVIGPLLSIYCQSPKIRQGLSSAMLLNSLNEQRTITDSSLNLRSP